MRNIILGALLSIVVLSSLSILFFYYSQNFNESFDFKSAVTSKELEIQTNQRGDELYLNTAKGEIGTLKLENTGIFPQVYNLPTLIGCLDLQDNIKSGDYKISNFQFTVSYFREGVKEVRQGEKLEIPVGKKETYKLIGIYNSYDVPLSAFSTETIKSISIYKIPRSEDNPITNDYNYNYNYNNGYGYYGDNCNTLKSQSVPLKVIKLQ